MAVVITLTGFRPPPRYDGIPWTVARIEEGAAVDGPWVLVENLALDPDADPTQPQVRNLTTALATSEESWFKVTFLDADGNYAPAAPVSQVPSGYPSTEDVLALTDNTDLLALDIEDVDALRLQSINAIEEYTGQSFSNEVATKRMRGTGRSDLWLPRRLSRLDEITVEGSSLTVADVIVTDDLARVYYDTSIGNYYVKTMRELVGDPLIAFPWDRDVTITGLWGWAPAEFPEAVATALRLDMEETASADANGLAGSVASFRKLGLRDISQGNLSASLTNPSALSVKVQNLLKPYVWVSDVGELV